MATKRRRTVRRTKIGDLLKTALMIIAAILLLLWWLLPKVLPDLWAGVVIGVVADRLLWAWGREWLKHHGKQWHFVRWAPAGAPKTGGQRARAGEDDERPSPRRNGGGK